ncbi:MAG: response regulator [Planctomycetota bacterium]
MKLLEIPASTVREAMEIYLRHAYPGDSRWRAPRVDLSGGTSAQDLVVKFGDESEKSGDRVVHRYVLRLGNSRYPHMKLVLEENLVQNQYVFSIDAHDDLRVSPAAPDFDRWNAVREHNRALREEIERAWRAASIPTFADLQGLVGAVERLSEAPRSVLIVDDDATICETLKTILERAGLRIRTARDGREALKAVAEERPHLILMDYQMPEMDGVAACEALKADPRTRPIPVLLATASQVDLSTLTYADGFLVKPYRQDILFSLVRKLLS